MHNATYLCALALQTTQQQAPPQDGAPQGNPIWGTLVMFGLIFVVFWFLLIRPQRKQQKERQAMLGQIKKNDHVVTSGGIFGIVDRVKENEVILKIDEKGDVRIRVLRSAIADIQKVSGAAGGEDKAEETDKK